MALYQSVFVGISIVALYLLWGLMFQNGTVQDMFTAALTGTIGHGRRLKTQYLMIPGVDTAIALLVAFFDPVTDGSNAESRVLTFTFLWSLQIFTTWLIIESSRRGTKSRLLKLVPIWGLLWNGIGVAVILPLYCYVHFVSFPKNRFDIPVHEAKVLLPSAIIGGIIPLIILQQSTDREPELHQSIIAIYQTTPLIIAFVQHLLGSCFVWFNGHSLRSSESHRYVRSTYLGLALIAGAGHIFTQSGILFSASPLGRFRKVYLPNHDLVSSACSHDRLGRGAELFLQYDWMVVNICCIVWACSIVWPEPRKSSIMRKIGFIMGSSVTSVMLGPGFFMSMLFRWREYRVEAVDRTGMEEKGGSSKALSGPPVPMYRPVMDPSGVYDCVVVGTGWNGLISAKTFMTLLPNANVLIIDESPHIGGVWSKERIYPSLYAQVGHGMFEYSSYPMPADGLTEDRYISGKTINEYLINFARVNGMLEHMKLGVSVETIKKSNAEVWEMHLGDTSTIRTKKLIWAGGATSGPYMPRVPQVGFENKIIHSSELGANLDIVHDPSVRKVTIVGAAKSAYDTVFTLAEAGKSVDWVIRDNGSGPLAIMPPTILGGFNTIDVMCTRIMASFSPAILATNSLWRSILHNTQLGRLIVKAFWSFVSKIADIHAGYDGNEMGGKLRPEPHGSGVFWANSGLGLASVPGFWKMLHSSDVKVHRTEVNNFAAGDWVNLKNGRSYQTDVVIMCTGWTENLGPFDEELRSQYNLPTNDDVGGRWTALDACAEAKVNAAFPLLKEVPQVKSVGSLNRPWRLYRCLVSPDMVSKGDRSIFFPGVIHTPFTPVVAEVQALWGVSFMIGLLELPIHQRMMEDVSLWNAWTKKRYLEQGKKHAYSIYDFLAYVDTLILDLGLQPKRKSSMLAECFEPYRPSDYKGLMNEFLEHYAEKLKHLKP